MNRFGTWLALFVAFMLPLNTEANSSRLTVVNEILEPGEGVPVSIPLYLSRLGTYFAELYLEVPEGKIDPSFKMLDVSIKITFLNGEKNVFEREVTVMFTPQKRVATLFYAETPSDLPQRRPLEMLVVVEPAGQSPTASSSDYRIQLTRKPQFLAPRR